MLTSTFPNSWRFLSSTSVLVALLGFPNVVGTESSASLKVNLDLPFNFGGTGEDDEDAPEVIFFYGGAYEASSVVFCLDESLTMRNENRFEIQNREAMRAISELSEKAEFGVVFYGGGVHAFRPKLTVATAAAKGASAAFIKSRRVNLGTCTGTAVIKALRMLRKTKSRHRAVILVSDGQATTCPFTPIGGCEGQKRINQDILSEIRSANSERISIHTLFVGRTDICNDSIRFMKAISDEHLGTFRRVSS